MTNAIFEQYGYKSARDLLTEVARDISDGGDLLFVKKPQGTTIKQLGYWAITYKSGRVVAIDYCETSDELNYIMGV